MHRFFIEQKLRVGAELVLPQDVAHQLAQVLRMKAGERVIFFDGSGFDFPATLTAINKKEIRVEISAQEKNTREPQRRVTLFQAVIKKDKMEWVAEKATEVGVIKIIPVIAERSVKTGVNETRLSKIIKEAAEQSGRGIVPEIGELMLFKNALKMAMEECGVVYIAHLPTGQAGEAADRSLTPASSESRQIGLFVGPEGGFSDAEIQAATALGAKIISLGSTVLRAETAAVCGVYRLVNGI